MKIVTEFPLQNVGASMPSHETVASYLTKLACRGKGCPGNNTSIASVTGLSVARVRAAKKFLIGQGRLRGGWEQWLSIDGHPFGKAPVNDVERLKDSLRRRFSPVCDVRTIEDPGHVPSDPPAELFVGDRRMTLAAAAALAEQLGLGVPA